MGRHGAQGGHAGSQGEHGLEVCGAGDHVGRILADAKAGYAVGLQAALCQRTACGNGGHHRADQLVLHLVELLGGAVGAQVEDVQAADGLGLLEEVCSPERAPHEVDPHAKDLRALTRAEECELSH